MDNQSNLRDATNLPVKVRTVNIVHHLKNSLLPYILALVLGALHLYLLWPGVMRPDAFTQYSQALSGQYSDHHPPAMALYWSFLDLIHKGPGLMYLSHLLLLWGSVLIFFKAVSPSKARWFYFIVPFFPQIMGHSFFVLKDIGFCYSFLFVSSILAYHTLKETRPTFFISMVMFFFALYGAAVKYQGIYIAPVLMIWLAFILNYHRLNLKTGRMALVLITALWGSHTLFNQLTTTHPSHSWQYVKLYDLAGISLRVNQELFPDFVKSTPSYSFAKVKALYTPHRVDEMAFDQDSPLQKGSTDEERNALWQSWFEAVTAYPMAYFKHRFGIFKSQMTISPIKAVEEIASAPGETPQLLLKIIGRSDQLGITPTIKLLTAFQFYFPLTLYYLFFGLFRSKTSKFARPLLAMNSMGMLLISILFFLSMASDARYIYLATTLLHFSHPFYFLTLMELRSRTDALLKGQSNVAF